MRVFADPLALIRQDRIEGYEPRWQALRMVDCTIMLLVAHTVREESGFDVIRIISARRAEPKERRRYEQENH